ncbi:MAG: nucleotide exchange factor GrpE [Proteobacteria bacterium]|nr:nucleotide exchange factor GrpE [Pseudomonadota bacterium]
MQKKTKNTPDFQEPVADEAAVQETTTPPVEEVNPLVQEVATLKDQVLRALAEAENTRRRAQKEVEDARKYAVSSFAGDLINVLENLYRAEESLPADVQDTALKNFIEGVKLTKNELTKVFDQHGLKRIFPQGETFDHNLHQAVVQIPSADVAPGTVVQVMQAGYVLKDRLLRPAMVGVSTAPEQA